MTWWLAPPTPPNEEVLEAQRLADEMDQADRQAAADAERAEIAEGQQMAVVPADGAGAPCTGTSPDFGTTAAAKRPAATALGGEGGLKRTRPHPAQTSWRTDLQEHPEFGLRYWSNFLNQWVHIDDRDNEYLYTGGGRYGPFYISELDEGTGERRWSLTHYDPLFFR